MQKELNPELFGTGTAGTTRFHEPQEASPNRLQHESEERIAELRSQMKHASQQMADIVSQVNEFIKVYQTKWERLQSQIKQMQAEQQTAVTDLGQRFTLVHQRLNERRSMDAKMQELVDRHNSILRSYEVRMNHLQKLISEKENQFLQSQSTLNEAKMEIARLKRL